MEGKKGLNIHYNEIAFTDCLDHAIAIATLRI